MTYIKTTYTDEKELISAMLFLYNFDEMVELDPCYSKGNFYKGFQDKPKYKFDLQPQSPDTIKSNCTSLPIEKETISSIMFDPPFVIGVGNSKSSIITNRFSGFRDLKELKTLYESSMIEFNRILKESGVIFFKCQDTVTSGKQFATHCWIIGMAQELGFTLHDIFILVRDRAIIDPKWGSHQEHARKTHSYYLVFSKGNKNPAKIKKTLAMNKE